MIIDTHQELNDRVEAGHREVYEHFEITVAAAVDVDVLDVGAKLDALRDAYNNHATNVFVLMREANARFSQMRADHDRLCEDLRRTRLAVEEARSHHVRDLAMIGDRLIELAVEHDWCELFDTEVAELNRELHFPMRERKVTANLTIEVDVEAALAPENGETRNDTIARIRDAVTQLIATALDNANIVDDYAI